MADFDFVTKFGFQAAPNFGDDAEARNAGWFIYQYYLVFHFLYYITLLMVLIDGEVRSNRWVTGLKGYPKDFVKAKFVGKRKSGRTRLVFVTIKNLCAIMMVINGGTI